jgi:hypothetical protein
VTDGAVSGGVERHRQSSLLNCQAVVEVDPIQATHKEWQALIDRAGTSGALACAAWFSPIAQERAGCWTFRNGSTKSSVSGSYNASWHEAETAERAGHTTGAGGDGWSAPSFRISSADGRLTGSPAHHSASTGAPLTGPATGAVFDPPAVRAGRSLAGQDVGGSPRVDGSDRRVDRLGCPRHRRHAGAERAGPGSPEPGEW